MAKSGRLKAESAHEFYAGIFTGLTLIVKQTCIADGLLCAHPLIPGNQYVPGSLSVHKALFGTNG